MYFLTRSLIVFQSPTILEITSKYLKCLDFIKKASEAKVQPRTLKPHPTVCTQGSIKMSTSASSNSIESQVNLARKRKGKYLGFLLAGCCFSKKSKETGVPNEQGTENVVQDVSENVRLISEVEETEDSSLPASPVVVAESITKAAVDCVTVKRKDKKNKPKKERTGNEKPPPNYFVAVQVDNPEIHDSLGAVQESLVQSKPNMKKALISLASLHITLVVMHIDQEEDLKRASEALSESFSKVKDELKENPLIMTFEGLSDFKKKVLYADLKHDEGEERLQTLYDKVASSFEFHGFDDIRERDSFTPHLTIAKLSKAPELRRKGIKVILPEWYNDHLHEKFGSQLVKGLQLLRMGGPKDDQGYYHCDHQCLFNVPSKETL